MCTKFFFCEEKMETQWIFESCSALIQKDRIHPWGGAWDQNLFALTCLPLKLRHASPQSRYNPSLMASCPMMALMFNQSKRVLPPYCWHPLIWPHFFIRLLLFTSFIAPTASWHPRPVPYKTTSTDLNCIVKNPSPHLFFKPRISLFIHKGKVFQQTPNISFLEGEFLLRFTCLPHVELQMCHKSL